LSVVASGVDRLVWAACVGSSLSSTHTNATPDLGKIQPSKPTSTDGIGTDGGLRTMRGCWALAMKSRVLIRRMHRADSLNGY
jgi:hypothetical protein